MTLKDLTQRRFTRLTAIRMMRIKNHAAYWQCVCDCGRKRIVRANNLEAGNTKSCGCLRMEMLSRGLNPLGGRSREKS